MGLLAHNGQIYQTAVELFGEENVDVQDKNYLVIHFPELTLTNEQGQKHKVFGIYVRLLIDSNETFRMEGTRLLYTLPEILQNYCHSHLKTRSGCWNDFCTGATMGTMTANARGANNDENKTQAVIMLLHTLLTYLSDESLEGGPYQRHQNVYQLPDLSKLLGSQANLSLEASHIPDGSLKFVVQDGIPVASEIISSEGYPERCYAPFYSPSLNQYISSSYFKLDELIWEEFDSLCDSFFSRQRFLKFKNEIRFCDIVPTPPISDMVESTGVLFPIVQNQILSTANSHIRHYVQKSAEYLAQHMSKSVLNTLCQEAPTPEVENTFAETEGTPVELDPISGLIVR